MKSNAREKEMCRYSLEWRLPHVPCPGERVLIAVDDHRYELAPSAGAWFSAELDVSLEVLPRGKRPLARRCLDWTERRPHLAGALGAAVLERFLRARWLVRREKTRALRISPSGQAKLLRLGLSPQLVQTLAAPR